MNDLPQAPEGVLDPQQPWWPADKISQHTWLKLKGKLTGRKIEQLGGEQHTSYVKITEAEADKLIENIKKYGQYPQVSQNDKYGGAYNNEAYQEWLVEEFLEKPFQKQRDAKIEDAAIESRLKEIQEEKIEELKKKAEKDKETVPLDRKEEEKKQEEEQEELDQSQEELTEKIDDLTEDIDSEFETPKDADAPKETDSPKEEVTENVEGISEIQDSLQQIQGSLQTQISDIEVINQNNSTSIASLETLKQLFQTQNDIFKRSLEQKEFQQEEKSSEQTKDVSGNDAGTSTEGDGKAEGIIQGIDGNILTIKPTEGEFTQGQKITQGAGGGFDLMGMIKGIAGKFGGGKGGGGKGGGGGSPIKMSQGGFLNSPYPSQSMAQGGFAPGVYDKPTRGNLLPGQAVIPLNRNVGKSLVEKNDAGKLRKYDQPMIDVMSQPLKAIGLSILAVAGNFLKSLGPLAGFFLPYAKGLVKGFAAILGVPATLIMGLLGGPAYAAMDQQDKQQNVFAKLWAEVMEKFGFGFLFGGDKKNKKKTGSTSSTATGQWGPLLDVIAGGEGNYTSVNPRLQRPEILDKTISELVAWQYQSKAKDGGSAASGRYQILNPETYATVAGLSMDEKFTPENQDKMAAAYIEKKRGGNDWLAGKISDEDFGKELAMEWSALEYPGKGGGFYDGDGRNQATVSFEKVKGALEKIKAERGVQIKVKDDPSLGKLLGWSVIDGPNSGYPVGDNLTMHGKEAYLQHENGMSILPIENNEYSLSKNPVGTLDRWKEILGSSNNVNPSGRYESGGSDKMSVINGGMRAGESEEQSGTRQSKPIKLADRLNKQSGLGKYAKPTPKKSSASTALSFLVPQSKSVKQSVTSTQTPQKTETDVMMDQYNMLTASGKHKEASKLGMQIWKKTDKGLERIPSTPLSATSSKANPPAVPQSLTPTASSRPSIVSAPTPQMPIIIPVMFDSRLAFTTQLERNFC